MAGFAQYDPIVSKYRSGVIGDEFATISLEPHKIIQNQILLSELPYSLNKVVITDSLSTVYSETLSTSPSSNSFYVNYVGDSAGIVVFNADKEGRNVFASYSGRGLQFFPIARIWSEKDVNGNVTKTLKDDETTRNTNETSRADAESTRISSENTRISNENIRTSQETARETHKNSWKYLGEYNALTAYVINNQVTHTDGTSYICIQNSTGNLPTNLTYWKVFAQAGEDGTLDSIGGRFRFVYNTPLDSLDIEVY